MQKCKIFIYYLRLQNKTRHFWESYIIRIQRANTDPQHWCKQISNMEFLVVFNHINPIDSCYLGTSMEASVVHSPVTGL